MAASRRSRPTRSAFRARSERALTKLVEVPAPEAAKRPSARADLFCAALLVVFGAAVVVGAWNMDRLQNQGATLYSYPGLVPGLLGAAIALMGAMLGGRAVAQGAFSPSAPLWPPWARG